MPLPNYDAWLEAPYAEADREAAAREQWAEQHGGPTARKELVEDRLGVLADLPAEHRAAEARLAEQARPVIVAWVASLSDAEVADLCASQGLGPSFESWQAAFGRRWEQAP